MQFQFVQNDPDKLANYVCFLGKQIATNFYQENRFLVLPKLVKKNVRTIYFPDLPYSKSFWKNLCKFSQNDDIFDFGKLKQDVLKLTDFADFQTAWPHLQTWQENEKKFLDHVAQILPEFDLRKINSIEVLVTKFGSVGSLLFEKNNGKFDFHLTVREDFGPSHVAETFLTLLCWIENDTMAIHDWKKIENSVDFLLSKSTLGKIFPDTFQPTIDRLEIPENLVIESQKYLSKLGFPPKALFSIRHSGEYSKSTKSRISKTQRDAGLPSVASMTSLFLNDKPIHNIFTSTEERILKALIENKNEVLTYDEIGNLFWGEQDSLEKFSLQSIAKIIEKIRTKIRGLGINQEMIFTIKGQGYVMYD